MLAPASVKASEPNPRVTSPRAPAPPNQGKGARAGSLFGPGGVATSGGGGSGGTGSVGLWSSGEGDGNPVVTGDSITPSEAVGSIATAAMSASAEMTSAQVFPVTSRSASSV